MAEPAHARTWKPGAAGAIAICVGTIEVALGLVSVANPLDWASIYLGLAVYMLGLVAITGGILARKRRAWRLALTGAICSLLASVVVPALTIHAMSGPPIPGAYYDPVRPWLMILGGPLWILGILAVVWTALSKREFR